MAVSAIFIVISKNPIHSILFLILTFISSTIFFLILNVEFISMLFLVVYIGAIAILFLFVVMMLNIKIVELNEKFIKYLPIGGFVILMFLFEILYLIKNFFILQNNILINLTYIEYISNINTYTNLEGLSQLLFTDYLYLFIICGMILLVAMVGAIILTLNQKFFNKRQDIVYQINKKLNESLNLFKFKKQRNYE